MGAEPLSIPIEDLLAHSGWVRALARSLVRDAGLAEDLVQDTWLAALRSPPSDRRNLRGWLGRVLTNAARERGRRAGARERVESSAVPGTSSLDPEDLAAAAESQRALTAHVLELEEPYRAAVLLRYWHGQNATQIAAREGVSPSTVRWRLKEGLERLRVRLDDTHGGDRKAWCLALVPLLEQEGAVLAGSATLPALVSGVLGMNLFLKFALFVTTVALAFFGLQAVTGLAVSVEPALPLVAAAQQEPAQAASEPASGRAQADRASAKAAALETPGAGPVAALASEPEPLARVTARIVDESGAPVPRASLSVMGAPKGASGDGAGEIVLDVRLREHSLSLALILRASGHATRYLEAVATRGEVLELGDLVLAPGGNLAGRVLDEDGNPVAGASVEHDFERIASGGIARARRERSRSRPPWTAVMTQGEGGYVLEGLPLGEVRVWARREGRMAAVSGVVEVVRGEVRAVPDLVLERIPSDDVIAGRVLDPEGKPVPHALVTLQYRSWLGSGSSVTTTDENGEFAEFCDSSTRRDVRARVSDERFQEVLVRRVRPGTVGLELRMGVPETLVFDVQDERGGRVEGVELELRQVAGGPRIPCEPIPRDDGTLGVTTPGEPFLAVLRADGRRELELGPFEPGDLPQAVECVLEPLPTLRGSVRSRGLELANAQIEVHAAADGFTQMSGFPVRVSPASRGRAATSEQGAFQVTLRDAGTYFLRAELAGEGVLEVGPFTFDPERGLDLGELELLPGGAIEGFVRAAAGESVAGTIVAVSRGDARARTARVGADGAFRFEGLIEGPWQVQVAQAEINPVGSGWSSDGLRPVGPIPSNCTVVRGQATRFDLEIGSRAACSLSGRLMLDGEPAAGWSLGLHAADLRVFASDSERVRSDADGAFRLTRSEPGSYRLLVEGDLDANLIADLELGLGESAWSAQLELAELDLEGLSLSLADGVPAAFVVWEREGWWALASVVADDQGAARGLRVPAGSARVCLFDLSILTGGDPRELPTLLELELPAGARTLARLP